MTETLLEPMKHFNKGTYLLEVRKRNEDRGMFYESKALVRIQYTNRTRNQGTFSGIIYDRRSFSEHLNFSRAQEGLQELYLNPFFGTVETMETSEEILVPEWLDRMTELLT